MPVQSRTFLTLSEAVDAVAADFSQYGCQTELYWRVARLALGENFRRPGQGMSGKAQVRISGHGPFTPVDSQALGFYLVHVLETGGFSAVVMAKICSLVFQAPARPVVENGTPGVRISFQMENFECRRCGRCCRRLANACAPEDLALWTRLGRQDILAWVKADNPSDGRTRHRIWVDPETGRTADVCPFLGRMPDHSRFFCRIQAVKPQVCREYPLTFKHARMTGCNGRYKKNRDENNR